jgi:hypothetical protein
VIYFPALGPNPGHGPISKKDFLMTYRNNAEALRNKVQAQVRMGKSRDQMAKFMTDEYKWAPDSSTCSGAWRV